MNILPDAESKLTAVSIPRYSKVRQIELRKWLVDNLNIVETFYTKNMYVDQIVFYYPEDAVVFKLKFGL